jgi:hypothetical protein
VLDNANYKIMFMLDSLAMITVDHPKYGVIEVKSIRNDSNVIKCNAYLNPLFNCLFVSHIHFSVDLDKTTGCYMGEIS